MGEGEIMSHCVTQAGLKFASTLLLWLPKCEPNKCEPACPGLFLASSAVTSHLGHYHFNHDSCLWFLPPFNVLTSSYNTSRSLFRTEKHRPGTQSSQPDDVDSIPRSHMTDRTNSCKMFSDLPTFTHKL